MGWFTLVGSWKNLAAPQQGPKYITSWLKNVLSILFPSARHSCSLLGLLLLFSTYWSFLWAGFLLWLHSTKKLYSPRLEWWYFGWRKQIASSQSTCTQDELLFRSFTITCLLFWFWTMSGLFCQDVTWYAFVIIYSVHKQNFASPWLWDVNCGNSYISLAILWFNC